MKEIRKKFHCPLSGHEAVTLTIEFGDGQTGTTFYERPDGSFVNGDVFNNTVGTPETLKGSHVTFSSLIVKTNIDTEFASATYHFGGGANLNKTVTDFFELAQKNIRFIVTVIFPDHEK
jgi:hypothetical protein